MRLQAIMMGVLIGKNPLLTCEFQYGLVSYPDSHVHPPIFRAGAHDSLVIATKISSHSE